MSIHVPSISISSIVEEIDDLKVEITLEEAVAKDKEAADLETGDVFVEVIDPRVFGRRLITTAKQFFAQRLRDVERNYIYEDYASVDSIADAWLRMYELGPHGRQKLGQKAKAYAAFEFNYGKVIDRWHETLTDTYNKFQEKKARWSITTY